MKNFLQVLLVGTILVGAGDVFAKVVAITMPEGGGLAKNILDYGNNAESVLVTGGANATLAQRFGWWESNIYGANKGWDVYGVKDLNSISGNGSYKLYDTDTGNLVGSYHNGTVSYNQTGQALGLKNSPAASVPKVDSPATPSATGGGDFLTTREIFGESVIYDDATGIGHTQVVNGVTYRYSGEGIWDRVPTGGGTGGTGASDLALNFTSQDAAIKAGMSNAGSTYPGSEAASGAGAADLSGESFSQYGSDGGFSSVSGTRLEAQANGTLLDPSSGYSYRVENGSLVRVNGAGALGGASALTNIPSPIPGGITAQVLEINGDMAKVSMYGMEYNLPRSKLGQLYSNGATTTTVLRPEALGSLTQGFGGYIKAGLGNFGATFGNFFGAAKGLITKPFSIISGLWNDAGGTIGGALNGFKEGLGRIPGNVQAIFGAGDKVVSGTSAVDSLLKAQGVDASKLTAEQQAALASKIAQAFPIRIWNYGEYATVIMQTHEAGKQNDTTKEVKVKAENALLASQGAPTGSTVGGVSLEGTNLATAASQMAWLLDSNPVDLNLLKTRDLDLKKDKDQKTLRQRRDLLLQMYATSAQIIAEGSNDISEKFYERIEQLSESLTKTTGSLGSASVLNDSERYPYFEMIRQTALSATQLGLKGASILPNLRIVAPESDEQ